MCGFGNLFVYFIFFIECALNQLVREIYTLFRQGKLMSPMLNYRI